MSKWKLLFCSSIGRKVLMSFSGLVWVLFLISHVAANLLVLIDPHKLNEYSHTLTSNQLLLYTAEVGLLGALLIHIYLGIRVTQMNSAARPVGYVHFNSTGRSRRWWGSRHMLLTGGIIFAFLVFHLWHFKFGTHYTTEANGMEIRDLSRLMIEDFRTPLYAGIYILAMLLIGAHLFHGVRSSFDTLGVNTTRRDVLIKRLSQVYVLLVFGGFILIPLVIFLRGGQS